MSHDFDLEDRPTLKKLNEYVKNHPLRGTALLEAIAKSRDWLEPWRHPVGILLVKNDIDRIGELMLKFFKCQKIDDFTDSERIELRMSIDRVCLIRQKFDD